MQTSSLQLYKRLLTYTSQRKGILIFALVAIALSGMLEAGLFALLKPILDQGFFDKDPEFIKMMPFILIGVFLIKSAFGFFGNVGMQFIAQKVIKTLRQQMFDRLITLPIAEYNKTSSGALLSKLTFDVNQLLTISSFALVTLIKDSAAIIGLLFVMFYNSWQISLVMFVVAPFIAITLRIVSKRLRKLSHRAQSEMGELNHITEETIRGNKEIKLFNAYDFTRERFEKTNEQLQRVNVKIMVASEIASPLVQLLIVFCIAFIISYAAHQVSPDGLTPGAFLTTLGAMVGLLNPIKRLTRLNESLQRGLAGAESVFSLIDAPIEKDVATHHNPEHLPLHISGDIRFDHVGFRYGDDLAHIFKDLSINIRPKETVALVGASGSGKSTFANLLAGFYTPTEGKVLVDGYNVAELSLRDYRQHISYVSQHVVLFADTLANNIALGDPNPDWQRIEAAAKNANAWGFISAMPEGLHTHVGENGAKLSGGQRQRIAIARALYKKAPILILDEATSSLDTKSEFDIQESIKVLSEDTTTIIIAHRLSTIEQADRIVVFEQGKIVEMGTHQELLEKNNIYASLYRLGEESA
ncbi:lipid A export permease/ATP-binding protein MsbA [Wohlfahrtiimonas chitiniclastica]|uniref:Lipid A export ATP-binding/permease protein MsbA n=1 Tax=Wohlfahrtiimonas chitiniclastica SH04 TaxID=1261130 RepID=L8XUP0_9GAMM|nr:lipid A export permease/ATP-binding protein MsbA [Wohlfahrtiimonas chitiniclastica]ELV07622.1 Lipid A export ATP-binding/permease protein MsbA [Wohlfahrtiimonas chitiniclastica SH04]KZX36370.1 lipid A export permease/ATP-binding protein MsbA [Wohlfahrtiimonas chitiniclastica]MBS7818576.1 lipid A export permease/ATP-binding protein MsbA [Wohlfahrtiimonas chitiniclastica]MBS7820788.1 lipid A export permease/ATP-binding protein MsbA [Wohlfahrtiimonas chitiniclastica]MBS7828694.1 lipid A export